MPGSIAPSPYPVDEHDQEHFQNFSNAQLNICNLNKSSQINACVADQGARHHPKTRYHRPHTHVLRLLRLGLGRALLSANVFCVRPHIVTSTHVLCDSGTLDISQERESAPLAPRVTHLDGLDSKAERILTQSLDVTPVDSINILLSERHIAAPPTLLEWWSANPAACSTLKQATMYLLLPTKCSERFLSAYFLNLHQITSPEQLLAASSATVNP